MNFLKKIVDGEVDASVHAQFTKFSKGEFINRAVIKARQSKGKFTINTSAEFANDLVRVVAKKLGSEKTQVTGAIVSTSDLKEKIDYTNIKQFQGVKRYLIDKEMSGDEIVSVLEEFPKTFFALTFEGGDSSIKIKPKAPKAPKPGKNGEKPKADFCKLITKDAELGKSFVFEKPDFKKAEIVHTYFITSMVIPETDEKDFAKIREMTKRKGKIVRDAEIDEVEMKRDIEFEA
jgi:hypothetical protein